VAHLLIVRRESAGQFPPDCCFAVVDQSVPDLVRAPGLLVWRAAHGLIATGFRAAIGYVWWCALTGRRGRLLQTAIAALAAEGILVIANRGDCPLAALGDRIGDPVPLFELVLSPRGARSAVPALGALTAVGLGLLAARFRVERHLDRLP
jgi:hypothetical protein